MNSRQLLRSPYIVKKRDERKYVIRTMLIKWIQGTAYFSGPKYSLITSVVIIISVRYSNVTHNQTKGIVITENLVGPGIY